MPRAQCIVYRGNKVLMVRHQQGNLEWWCLPGGGIHDDESPSTAALRELHEECNVTGRIIRETSVLTYWDDKQYTYLVDIGEQKPQLGYDPEGETKTYVLAEIAWLELWEIPERDRSFLWAAGLMGIKEFFAELEQWTNDISYPEVNPIQ